MTATSILHITNGTAIISGMRSAGIEGVIVPWEDALHEGPVPQGLNVAAMRDRRAEFLAACGWGRSVELNRMLAERDAALESAASRLDPGRPESRARVEEIVLWFEFDLYDQLQLLQVLERLPLDGSPRVTAVADDEYLGHLSPARLGAIFTTRREVTSAERLAARDAWTAFRSPDPRTVLDVLPRVTVLRHLGVTFGVLRKERCNGDPARRLGNDLLFSQLAEPNIEHIRQSNVKKMLTICPHCVRTISEDWRDFGATFEIEHHSEFLARVRSQLPASASPEKVVFHDPCYLGRYKGVYEEPRAVASLAGDVIDPPRARNRSRCCGAGGGLAFLGEEKGKRVNVDRAEELVATGAGIVGAACPFCQTMFRDALGAVTQTPPKLLDIVQIAAASLPRDGSGPVS